MLGVQQPNISYCILGVFSIMCIVTLVFLILTCLHDQNKVQDNIVHAISKDDIPISEANVVNVHKMDEKECWTMDEKRIPEGSSDAQTDGVAEDGIIQQKLNYDINLVLLHAWQQLLLPVETEVSYLAYICLCTNTHTFTLSIHSLVYMNIYAKQVW